MFKKIKPPLDFEPGTEFKYSNTGYVLLSVIIERASGEAFAKFMNHAIFQPLEMNDSAIFNLSSSKSVLNHRVYGFKSKSFFNNGKELHDLSHFFVYTGQQSPLGRAFLKVSNKDHH